MRGWARRDFLKFHTTVNEELMCLMIHETTSFETIGVTNKVAGPNMKFQGLTLLQRNVCTCWGDKNSKVPHNRFPTTPSFKVSDTLQCLMKFFFMNVSITIDSFFPVLKCKGSCSQPYLPGIMHLEKPNPWERKITTKEETRSIVAQPCLLHASCKIPTKLFWLTIWTFHYYSILQEGV